MVARPTDDAAPTTRVRRCRNGRHDWPCIATTDAHTSGRPCRPRTCALLGYYISTYISPLAPQSQRPAANGGCRSPSRAMIGEIAVLGCKPRACARQSAQRTSPGWSRRCCRTTLSVRLKSITGQSSRRPLTDLAHFVFHHDQPPAAVRRSGCQTLARSRYACLTSASEPPGPRSNRA